MGLVDRFADGCLLSFFVLQIAVALQTDYEFDANVGVVWNGKQIPQIQFRKLKTSYPSDTLPKLISCTQEDEGGSPICYILHRTHFDLISPKIMCSLNQHDNCILETSVALKEDDAILLSQIPSLIFWSKQGENPGNLKNKLLSTCYGNQNSECNPKIQPKSIYCLNSNYGLSVYPSWNCQGKLRSNKFSSYLISNITISCDGYYGTDDSFKRKESCELKYSWFTFERVKQEFHEKNSQAPSKNKQLDDILNFINSYGIYASIASLCIIIGGLVHWTIKADPTKSPSKKGVSQRAITDKLSNKRE